MVQYKNKQEHAVYFLFHHACSISVTNEAYNMGGKGEQGVLKLVHPGRHVEYLREPVTAAEVLKKNPRHSVARPDVFEYPWIVVRPESVLNLGRVFYIVPNRTIYKLIKDKGYSIQPSLQQNHSPKDYRQRKILEQSSPSKSSAGTTPKHEDYCQSDWEQFQPSCEDAASQQDRVFGDQSFNLTEFDSLPDIITKYQSAYQEFKRMSETDTKTAVAKQDDDDAPRIECKEVVTGLKPCLRKHGSARKLLQLKVSFSLPTNSEERKRKVTI